MTNEQAATFYRELAKLCNRYKIGAFSGIWFGGKDSDNYGFIETHDITDTNMKQTAELFKNKLIEWTDGFHKGDTIGKMREMVSNQKSEGN